MPTTPASTTSTPARSIRDLSPAALDALTARLRQWTGRPDVEILAITGVRSNSVRVGPQTHGGIGIDVDFTYTRGRRQRRPYTVAWPVGVYTSPSEPSPNLPQCLWNFLTAAVAAHGQPA